MIRRSYWSSQGPSGASTTPLPSTNPGSAGVSTAYARADHTHPPDLWASGYVADMSDRTTTSLVPVAFGAVVNLNIIYANTFLMVWFAGNCSNSSANQTNTFYLYIDGAPVVTHAVTCRTANSPYGIAPMLRTSLSVGAHTAQGYWKTDGGTAQVRAATFPDTEHFQSMFQLVIH